MAKEKFTNTTLTGDINVACKFEDGSVRYWSTTKEETIQHIIDIVNDYTDQGYILTLRQLHYQLVSNNWIVNHVSAYKKLGTILDDCRYGGIIDWDAIEDRGRVPYLPYSVRDVEHALQDTADQYRIDRQEGQKHKIELWTEKDALAGILRRSTNKYHIRLVVNKGYTSSSAIYTAYQRIIENLKAKKATIILYFGDHDPSGLDMVRDIRERLDFMLRNGDYELTDEVFLVKHIGLTMPQINQHELPENPTKVSDPRAKKYVEEFGKTCWEVDALKPPVLSSIVESNIEKLMDMAKFQKMLKLEEKGIKEIQKLIDDRKSAPGKLKKK